MFLRWTGQGAQRSVAVVESVRVNGSSRQRVVGAVGTVPESPTVRERRTFHDEATKQLAKLLEDGKVTPEQRADLEWQVERAVPRLTLDERIADCEALEAACEQVYTQALANLRQMRSLTLQWRLLRDWERTRRGPLPAQRLAM